MFKSDTNQMGVLQLFCSIVHEWIKGAPNLCLVLDAGTVLLS